MAQHLEDQIMIIERALGERMITHTLTIVRAWLTELGENNPFEQAFRDIDTQYRATFQEWLTSEDATREERLDALTGDAYRLVDAVYVALRLKRGLSPVMHGFNKDNPKSVMHYFANCVALKEDDYKWLCDAMNDADKGTTALMAVAALAKNIRECFNEEALLALIEGINGDNHIVAEQCLANMIILLAHYDVRIDFFPQIQNAFAEAVASMGDENEEAFQTVCALIRSTKVNWKERLKSADVEKNELPPELQTLLEMTENDDTLSDIMSWVPESEQEYMQGIVQMLPDTWVFDCILNGDEERCRQVAMTYLSVGVMDMLWEHIDEAAQYLRKQLRKGSVSPLDYINYGHCMLLQGDRLMAYENYRVARQLCKNSKDFFTLFRPGRRALVDHGVPLEQVYFLEDQLLNTEY